MRISLERIIIDQNVASCSGPPFQQITIAFPWARRASDISFDIVLRHYFSISVAAAVALNNELSNLYQKEIANVDR